MLVHTDSMVALEVINKGYSRHRTARLELQAIALMSAEFGFEVRCAHVSGVDNPADQPSRGPAVSEVDWTFSEFAAFNEPKHVIDCCAAGIISGHNKRCKQYFS